MYKKHYNKITLILFLLSNIYLFLEDYIINYPLINFICISIVGITLINLLFFLIRNIKFNENIINIKFLLSLTLFILYLFIFVKLITLYVL